MTLDFALSQAETEVAAARFAWRAALSEGLLARHIGPLAAFALAVTFAAILGLTGLIGRRSSEIALILSAGGYMAYRLWTRRQFLAARRAASAWAETLRAAAPLRVSLDADGLHLQATGLARHWLWAQGLEVESVAGLVYVWPPRGPPLVWPAEADPEGAALHFAQARARTRSAAPAVADDDD